VNLPVINIADFNYPLADEQIAKYPLEKRSASKLLHFHNGIIEHTTFKHLPDLLPPETLLVFNNTKVIEARLLFTKPTGAHIEVFLLNPANPSQNASLILDGEGESTWQCMVGNKKRWKENEVLRLQHQGNYVQAAWVDRENNLVKLQYNTHTTLAEILTLFGNLPIPPYLNRPTENIDLERYQTSFARFKGSVAAPTAALHFDDETYEAIHKKGIGCEYLTLHVGAGTFKPVTTENAVEHPMHQEFIVFTQTTIQALLQHTGPTIAVGTTSLRSLESLFWFGIGLKLGLCKEFNIEQYLPYQVGDTSITAKEALLAVIHWMKEKGLTVLEGTSSIYIIPGYKPRMVRGMVTNFHQPKSTLLLLVSAMVGNAWKDIYQAALENNYRFLSYGDSSLLMFTT
jgi:S-adenosylmethionine:tRNA ribosyltransferase-isomerase